MNIEIQHQDNFSLAITPEKNVFALETIERANITGTHTPVVNYTQGDYIVYPFGDNNHLPQEIREVVKNNYLAPGLLTKKTQLLWGLGPQLFTEKKEGNRIVRELAEDNEVEDWLESNDYINYLMKCCVDYSHIDACFSKLTNAKGIRIGRPKILKVEHLDPRNARLANHRNDKIQYPKYIIETMKSFDREDQLLPLPIATLENMKKHQVLGYYSNYYSFASDYYSIPDLYGTLEWLRRSTKVPLIFKALSKNSLNVKYHITSPQEFWDQKEEDLKEKAAKAGVVYNKKMLTQFKENLLRQISEVLTGDEAYGKFWHTTKSFVIEGTNLIEYGWEIKEIPQNIKELVEAQIKISERADYAVAGGLNVHGALGNISSKNTANSGSEQLYAFKNYMATGVSIPEYVVTRALNMSIKFNWPTKKLKVGFLHNIPEREQDISPKDRMKNNF